MVVLTNAEDIFPLAVMTLPLQPATYDELGTNWAGYFLPTKQPTMTTASLDDLSNPVTATDSRPPSRAHSERSIMVKAKRIKELRKQVERAERVQDPFEPMRRTQDARQQQGDQQPALLWRGSENHGVKGDKDNNNITAQTPVDARFSIEYRSSAQDLSSELVDSCLDLFVANMGELYRNSSFGLDLDAKRSELTHRKARYLLVFEAAEVGATHNPMPCSSDATTRPNASDRLAAFVHFRYCLDDDEAPSCAVLYVYEIQVLAGCSGQGLGTELMNAISSAALAVGLKKVVLTALKSNPRALRFYKGRLGFAIDETDPSTCGDVVDYEILSKVVSA
jgi:N-alpha-acetyltransferase 40